MPEVDSKPASRLVTAVMALPLMAVLLGAVFLPPALAYSLVRRGATDGHPSWVALGLITAALWLFGFWRGRI